MSSFLENAYSLVHQDNAADVPSQVDLKNQLEKGTDDSKIETMKRILTIMLNGDPMPGLLMHIIRFVMPSKSKPLKKLLYFYYEICPKLDASGKLKQEMILIWYVLPGGKAEDPADEWLATTSETTCNIPTSTSAATHCGSFASCAKPSSSSPSSPRLGRVSNTGTPTCAKALLLPSPPFSSIRRR